MSSRLTIAKQPPHKVQGWSADCNAFPRLSLIRRWGPSGLGGGRGTALQKGEQHVLGCHCDSEQGPGQQMDFNSTWTLLFLGNGMAAHLSSVPIILIPPLLNLPSQLAVSVYRSCNHMWLFWSRSSCCDWALKCGSLGKFTVTTPWLGLSIRACQVSLSEPSIFGFWGVCVLLLFIM